MVVEVSNNFFVFGECLFNFGNPSVQFFFAVFVVEPDALASSMPSEISQIRG